MEYLKSYSRITRCSVRLSCRILQRSMNFHTKRLALGTRSPTAKLKMPWRRSRRWWWKQERRTVTVSFLNWRNTLSEQLHWSPAQILYGWRTRSKLPIAQTLLATPMTKATRDTLAAVKQRQAVYYDARTKEKSPMSEGQTVRVKMDDSSN